ncbi:hypothetical protein [Maridesulfovibrio ferrireducens]|uniref:hypothetical protein n=1 Tax=Maridesulfovibrio ferrireducens TaxID=246191 RepID=UPI001A288AA9|nr:hypothetical protein [Maridesulfovibrio ferrireducens]MBI9111613.1 hypothetical protein [Maridesulfovibrio ferrireducens]
MSLSETRKRQNKLKSIFTKFVIGLFGIILILWSMPLSELDITTIRGQHIGLTGRWTMTAIGLIIIGYSVFYKPKLPSKMVELEDTICPTCETPFGIGEAPQNELCPRCKVLLEPLKGFYDRHPELKDIKSEKN